MFLQIQPIREIVDRCRVWESHSEQKRGSSPGTDLYRGHTGVSSDSRESNLFMENSLRTVGCHEVESRIPVPMASVVQSDLVGAQEVGSGWNRDASPGILPSLIARLLRAAQEDNPAEVKVPPDAGARRPSVAPFAGMSGQSQVSEAEPVMVCFSCGRPGHGVNRCSRVDTSFPFLPPGWSVDIRDGQYRAVWPGGSMARFQSGNEGWSGREGQPPGPSVTVERLTPAEGSVLPQATRNRPVWASPVGHVHGSGWSSTMQVFPPLGSHPPVFSPGIHDRDNRRTPALAQPVLEQMDRVVQDSPIGVGGTLPSLVAPVSGAR